MTENETIIKQPEFQQEVAEISPDSLLKFKEVQMSVDQFNTMGIGGPSGPETADFMSSNGLEYGHDIIVHLDDGRSIVMDTSVEDFGTRDREATLKLSEMMLEQSEDQPEVEDTDIESVERHSEAAQEGIEDLGVQAIKITVESESSPAVEVTVGSSEQANEVVGNNEKTEAFREIAKIRDKLRAKVKSYADHMAYSENNSDVNKTKVESIHKSLREKYFAFDSGDIDADAMKTELTKALDELQADVVGVEAPFGSSDLIKVINGKLAEQAKDDPDARSLLSKVDEVAGRMKTADAYSDEVRDAVNRFVIQVQDELPVAMRQFYESGNKRALADVMERTMANFSRNVLEADHEAGHRAVLALQGLEAI
jgi:hypothetical protein